MNRKIGLYCEVRAAQAAAFFLHKAGDRVPLPKLMKLMYLAERTSLQRYGEPLTGDCLFSMEHGPALAITPEHMNGMIDSSRNGWDAWISRKENRELALADPGLIRTPEDNLLALSDADLEILNEIWTAFSHLNAPALI